MYKFPRITRAIVVKTHIIMVVTTETGIVSREQAIML
jgi:hypothetical protein